MLCRWFVRKQAQMLWDRLSDQRIDDLPIAKNAHFVYLGDHPLATEINGADAMRGWLRTSCSAGFPGCVSKSKRSSSKAALGRLGWPLGMRRSATASWLPRRAIHADVWGKLVEERVLPDSKALDAALE
jgi:hypothetical protein